jgi:hypothetical protein
MSTYLCVGGPWNGQIQALQPGAQSVIVALHNPALQMIPAIYDSPEAPPYSVTVHQAVYKLSKYKVGPGVTVEVLAYFGKDGSDRPKGFYL